MAQVVECLPNKYKALSSIPSIAKIIMTMRIALSDKNDNGNNYNNSNKRKE
jgi:hypothetical protein